MAPVAITDDLYAILGIDQSASSKEIGAAYKRLALKLHPDKNPTKPNAEEAFKQLVNAYEVLKDDAQRRDYDCIYPLLKRARASDPNNDPLKPRSPPSQSQSSENDQDVALIAALEKSKKDRGTQWQSQKRVHESSIFEKERAVRRINHEIEQLNSISAAEQAEEAAKNSWTTWFLSPFYVKKEDTEEQKQNKEIGRQERRLERDMKERRLDSLQRDLRASQDLLRKGDEAFDAQNRRDDENIRVIQRRIQLRRFREHQERERAAEQKRRDEQELWARLAQRAREQAAARRQAEAEAEQAQWRAARETTSRARKDENAKRQRPGAESSSSASNSCLHGGWWPKVEKRAPCPKCFNTWNYLLKCPTCSLQACASCQAAIRPRMRRRSPHFRYEWNYFD